MIVLEYEYGCATYDNVLESGVPGTSTLYLVLANQPHSWTSIGTEVVPALCTETHEYFCPLLPVVL